MSFAIVTISDTRSTGLSVDESGEALKKLVSESGFRVVGHGVVPDEEERIKVCVFIVPEPSIHLTLAIFRMYWSNTRKAERSLIVSSQQVEVECVPEM